MGTMVYDKTDKGREEISTRKHQLASRLRTLLVMIDGRHTLDDLLRNFGGVGVTGDSVKELLQEGYIFLASGSEPDLAGPPSKLPMSARARQLARRAAGIEGAHQEADVADETAVAAPPPQVASSPLQSPQALAESQLDDATRFRHLYDFYNQTIKSTIGLRGIMLQLKVEKCNNVDDFRALRLQYLEAVLKAKGSEMARSLRGRLDELLGGAPEHDDFKLP
ncbi:hypothetical protein INH39_13935 [Massilia violaceinigra]|uniref:Proline-rich protein n=1 Tax=Massilia violaceinigra TaxID=2045208 RepID=A0ABY4AD36_9BURK|nr:hypothetical protein [Massilia violaceinigra]UOD32656.1 hypothetical protein INH39_13935 [Massilia violaceinigra]